MPEYQEVSVPQDARGTRLDKFLATALASQGLSRSRVQRLMEGEAIQVDGVLRPPKYSLKGGETLRVHLPQSRPMALKAVAIPLDVLYEDEDLLVINKQAGLVTHPGAGHEDDTLVNALLHHCGSSLKPIMGSLRPGIVHRLDKDTTGCLVAAKSEAAFTGLQAMIAAHAVTRLYLGLAWGDFPEDTGTIDAPLGRGADRKRMDVRPSGGKAAVTHFTVRERYTHACELECKLATGRTHQIRAHLRSIAHALVGDRTYGRAPQHLPKELREALASALPRQALHAYKLQFKHPVSGKAIRARAPEPDDYRAARKLLKAA